jgi:hypothetical protein
VIKYVQEQTCNELSESDVSRALKDYNQFETLSLKKIESHATEGRPVLRTLWHVMPPPMGHVGVSSASKWDINETFFYIRIQGENLDAEGWNAYLEEDLLPVCGPRRTFMMDNLMEAQLRGMQYIITKQNFHRCIIAAFRAATTPANRRAVFGHCGSNFGL